MSRARNLANLGDGSGTFKIGDTIWSSRSAAPDQWLACNGAAISRTTYAALFAAIGTAYGVGDGSTTFNLPDARGRSPVGVGQGAGLTNRARGDTGGAETHQMTESEMPLHGHPTRIAVQSAGTASSNTTGGALLNVTGATSYAAHTGAVSNTAGQQVGGTGGGQAHNNMQPFIAMNCFIYAGV